MRYWFDTEFIEDGKTIELVSIGIVAEDGREFYAEVAGVDYSRATDWVKQNVIRHLWSQKPDKREGNIWIRDGGRGGLLSRQHIAGEIVTFCDPEQYGKPEFWGYYADYDWVVLCQLFGRMMDLPNNWPMYCRDIKQECDRIGNPRLPEQGKDEHHALADARWNRTAWEFLAERNALRAERAEAALDSPTWTYVLAFARRMEAKLDRNRHKGNREGWLKDEPIDLLARLVEEVVELQHALDREQSPDTISAEAADVANFALMVADAYEFRAALAAASEGE